MSNGRLNEDRKRGVGGEDGARRVREEGRKGNLRFRGRGVSAFNEEKPQEGFA